MTSIDHQIKTLLMDHPDAAAVFLPAGRLAEVQDSHPVPVNTHAFDFTEVQDSGGNAIARQFPPLPGTMNTKQEDFDAAIAAGYTVAPEGFVLALGDADRAQFAQFLALVREALDLGLITGATEQTIKDKAGVLHTMTTDRLRQVLVGYGFAYKTLWDNLNE